MGTTLLQLVHYVQKEMVQGGAMEIASGILGINIATVSLTLFQLGRDNFYHCNSI